MIAIISRMTNMRKITTTTTMMMRMAKVTMMMLRILLLLLMMVIMLLGSNKVNSFLNMAMEECTGKENCNKGFPQLFNLSYRTLVW